MDVLRRLGYTGRGYTGLASDALVLATNLVFLTPVAGWFDSLVQQALGSNDPVAANALGLLLVVVFVSQMAGAFLKRKPLQARLAQRGPAGDMGCLGMSLLIFNFVLSLFVVATILALFGWTGGDSPLPYFAGFVVAVVPTHLVSRALSPKPPAGDKPWQYSPTVERVADVLLMPYVIANTLFFNFITGYVAPAPTSFEDFVFHVLSVGVVVFMVLLWYLPPRLLFLADDFRERGTWIRMIVAMTPIAFRWAIG